MSYKYGSLSDPYESFFNSVYNGWQFSCHNTLVKGKHRLFMFNQCKNLQCHLRII